MKKLDGQSLDVVKENVEKLKELFPSIVKEDKIDFDELELLLGENINRNNEQYSFTWNGKTEATKLAQKRSTGTLRPCKEESKDWDTTQNLYIEGDNLEVLRLLQASYNGRIKMIYIDPPYNTGHDFVYKDNFEDNIKNYKEQTGQAVKSNADTDGRYHTNWLNMMYPRLKLARTLLSNDGAIFISIDDHELKNLKNICDDIFGENNFIACITIKGNPRGRQSSSYFAQVNDYLLVYKKTDDLELVGFDISKEEKNKRFNKKDEITGDYYEEWELRKRGADSRREDSPNLWFPIYYNESTNEISLEKRNGCDIEIVPKLSNGNDGRWRWSKEKVLQDKNKLYVRKNNKGIYNIYEKKLYEEKSKQLAPTIWDYQDVNTELGTKLVRNIFDGKLYFDFPKPVGLIQRILELFDDKNFYILDFFSGSATTAHAIMNLNTKDDGNRKFIMVQLPELTDENSEAYADGYTNICEISKERIRRAGESLKNDTIFYQKTKTTTIDAKTKNALNVEENIEILENAFKIDIGFKVFKLDSSNLIKWDNTPTKDIDVIKDRIQSSIDYLKDDRNELDLVYEVMLKYGIDLSYPIKQTENKKAYIIEAPEYKLLVCTQPNLTLEDIESFANESVGTYLFADRCFNTDNLLINTEEILKSRNKEMRLF